MNDSSTKAEESPQMVRGKSQSEKKRSLKFALIFAAACFVLASAAIYFNNFRPQILVQATLFDSSSYITSTTKVLTVAEDVIKGTPLDEGIRRTSEILMFEGPILPGLGAIFFALIGKQPSFLDMRAPLAMEGFFHACTAALMALAGWRMTGQRVLGLSAGLLFAVWPSAIIGASRFLTETITTFFVVLAVVAGAHIPKGRREGEMLLSPLSCLVFGFSIILLMLVKAALAPGALLATAIISVILLLSKIQKRSMIVAAIAGAFGFLLVFAPWMTLTKVATGEFKLLPQRLPTYNMAAGQNPETDGWSALPETNLVLLFSEEDGPAAVATAFYKLNPGDFYGRMARKTLRLFQFPWNDCKIKALGLPLGIQIVLHQYLVIFGLFGLLAFISLPFFVSASGKAVGKMETANNIAAPHHPELSLSDTRDQFVSGINLPSVDSDTLSPILATSICMVIILGHLAYLPFVADGRYGSTAIPCLMLLAFWCLAERRFYLPTKPKLVRLFIAASFIMLAFSLKYEPWRSLFAAGTSEIYTSSMVFGSLLLFIGCLLAVRTLLGSGRTNVAPKVLALLVSYLSLTIFLAASLGGKEIAYDWEAKLTSKEELFRTVDLPEDISISDDAFVVANIKGDWRAVRLKVNGQEVKSFPISLLQSDRKDISSDYRTFGNIFHVDTGGLDQWRVFVVPPAMLKPGASNSLSLSKRSDNSQTDDICALTGCTVRGANQKSTICRSMVGPSLDVFSPTKMCNNPLCLDPRLRQEFPKTVVPAICKRLDANDSQTNDLSSSPGIQHGQYHFFLLVGKQRTPETKPVQNGHTIYMEVKPIAAKLVPDSLKEKGKEQFFAAAPIANELELSSVRLTWSGEITSPSPASVRCYVNDWSWMNCPVELTTEPGAIEGSGRRGFKISTIARSTLVDQATAYAMIKISSDRVPLAVSNLRLEVEPRTAPALNISGKRWY